MAEERSSSYICAEDISVGYHNLPLIQKINLHVNRGEILTLIGPNGAGKSTILKSLIGQLKLVKGAVWLDDHEGKRDCPSYVCDDDRPSENRADDL